jgi:hypothetical protein
MFEHKHEYVHIYIYQYILDVEMLQAHLFLSLSLTYTHMYVYILSLYILYIHIIDFVLETPRLPRTFLCRPGRRPNPSVYRLEHRVIDSSRPLAERYPGKREQLGRNSPFVGDPIYGDPIGILGSWLFQCP